MKITKRHIAELCAWSYKQGYTEAIKTLQDVEDVYPEEQMVDMMMKQMDGLLKAKENEPRTDA